MMAAPTASVFWLGTSWKMTKTLAETRAYVDELHRAGLPPGLRYFVLPPHTALAAAHERAGVQSPVTFGAQNAYPGAEGPVTGEVSMAMVRDAGARIVEIGHAERRLLFGEDDAMVADKVSAAVAAGLTPLICVGETTEQAQKGLTIDVARHQVRSALESAAVPAGTDVLIAYEPHWAIGAHGRAASPDHITPAVGAIRAAVDELVPSARTAVLYGGSVTSDNVHEYVANTDIDGLFVGRAAWSAAGFADLARRSAEALEERPVAGRLTRHDRKGRL